ncbi:type I restriction endonuclease subunit R, partial [Staphylococcus epidermidis]
RLNKKLEQPLTVAGIFTFKPNEDDRDGEVPYHSREKLEIMISDYNKKFETNFSTDTTNEYFNHISKNVKKGVKDSKIDILIVVNMFLTGFDSKVLNTLYVDKNLMYHDLIQAYSRTNRVEKESKPFGKIVNYRDLKKETDDALRVFSQTNDTDTILMRSYEEYK